MKKQTTIFLSLTLAFALLMSLPWLVPHLGWTALFGILPLLIMERLSAEYKTKHFFWWHFGAFVLWNALTTWWVCNATLVGGILMVFANAIQMSAIFGCFRWVKRRLGGVLPYIFLASAWIAWERYYLTVAQISWPWLVFGNAFAETTSLVQWYSVLGHLGGSLWVWLSNLSLFGMMVAFSDGRIFRWNAKARASAFAATLLVIFGPMIWSVCIPAPVDDGPELSVMIGQPNFDPYEKRESLTQEQQDLRFLKLLEETSWPSADEPVLVLAPETFTRHLVLDNVPANPTFRLLQAFLTKHPNASVIYGASTYETVFSSTSPDLCAFDMGDGCWILSRNSAIATDTSGRYSVYHKSKLVIGTELTPYPALFVPLEKALFGGPMMGKCIGQKERSCLPTAKGPVGVPICYESVYGEFCTGFVREGAKFLAVITNDAWWGNTPGYRQHLSFSSLRAIETRRWVARCGNTGVSGFIDPQGRIVKRGPWWEPTALSGTVRLRSDQTFFVRHGDIVGRCSVFLFLLCLLAAIFRPLRR